MANGKEMKKIKRFNESVINNRVTNLSQEIIDYLETWPDEYDDLKFKFQEIKTIIPSLKRGIIIQVEYVLPEILWRNQEPGKNYVPKTRSERMLLPKVEKNISFLDNQIVIWTRLKTLFLRLESLGCMDVKYKDATFLSQRVRSISVEVFISSDIP